MDFATLWYAGLVVLQFGPFETFEQCDSLAEIMRADIQATYAVPGGPIEDTIFPTNEFEVTCEDEYLEPDPLYSAGSGFGIDG